MLLNSSEIISWVENNPKQKKYDAERILSARHLIKCEINGKKHDKNVAVAVRCIKIKAS